MIRYVLHYEKEGMRLVIENNVIQITTTIKPKGQYPSHKIFHNHIAKCLSHVLDSLTHYF